MAINFPASPITDDTYSENSISWIFNGTSWNALDEPTTASDLGLGNVDNTSDASKPVSTAQAAVNALKAPLASPTFTGTVNAADITATGNVDSANTGANAPVSTAQRAALGFIDATAPAYGVATGNTAAANDTAFALAVAAAKAAYLPLYIPAGAYAVSDTISLDWEGAVIRGEGGQKFSQETKLTTTSTTAPVIEILGDQEAVKILDLYIVGPGRATSTGQGVNIVGSTSNIDFMQMEGVRIEGFGTGLYLDAVANSTFTRVSTINCNLGMDLLGNSNSNGFVNFLTVVDDGSMDATGSRLATGYGNTFLAHESGGPGMAICVEDGARSTSLFGGQFEARGIGIKTTTSTSNPTISGVRIRDTGAPATDRWSIELFASATLINTSLMVVNSGTGAAIKQNTTISRGLKYFGAANVTADLYATDTTTFNATVQVGGGIGVESQASGEGASATTLGVGWLRESLGSNTVYNFGVRNAANSYSWANLLDYHFDKESAGTAAAFLGSANTFTTTQTLQASSAPHIRIRTGADGGGSTRLQLGIATSSSSYATGTATGDSVFIAKAGGDICLGSSVSGTQIVRLKVKETGELHYVPMAEPTGQAGDVYFDSTSNKLRVYGASGWETITSA